MVAPHPGSSVIYHWDFDDGNFSTGPNKSVEHVWTSAGIYNITVVAQNNISSSTAFVSGI